METNLTKEKINTLAGYVPNWFIDNKIVEIMDKTSKNMRTDSLQLSFCVQSIKYESLELYRKTSIEQVLYNNFYKSHMN